MIECRPIEDRASWLAWRSEDVTASDVGALFGLSPFKTPLQLWAEKTGRTPLNNRENLLMRRGRWLEPAVLCALQETYPHDRIEKVNAYFRDPSIRLGATPDALMSGRRLVECKVIARPVFEAWPEGEPPVYYQLQALTGAMLVDTENAILACLVIDTYSAELVLFYVERTSSAEDRIRDRVAKFWDDIAEGQTPEADYGEDGALLAALYPPKDRIAAIDLTGDNFLPPLLIEREAHKETGKAVEARLDAINAEIVDKLKGAPAAICGPWKITHKMQHRREVIQHASSFPVLRVVRKREDAA